MSEKIRLFIAIEIPEAVTTALKRLSSAFPTIRFLSGPKAHLTIKFLGQLDQTLVEKLSQSLAGIKARSFELRFNGLGTFRTGSKMILWAGLYRNPQLTSLFQVIDFTLHQDLGLKKENRSFKPHITLARIKTFRSEVAHKAKEFLINPPLHFKVSSFGLNQSELTPTGAIHTLLFDFPLID